MGARARFGLWIHLAVLCANNGLCVYCNKARSEVMDHVLPFAQGGADSLGNLVPACDACNESKSDKTPPDWITGTRLRRCWSPANGMPRDKKHGLRARYAQVHRECEETMERIDRALDEIDDRARRGWLITKTMFCGVPSSRMEIAFFRGRFEKELAMAQAAGFPEAWHSGRSVLSLLSQEATDRDSADVTDTSTADGSTTLNP